MELVATQVPMSNTVITPGTIRCPGTNAILWICRANNISSAAATTLATTMAQTMLKVRDRLTVSMSGPGRSPLITSAPSRIAVPMLPGIPNATVGMSAPALWELLAVSGAITPRISPRPKRDLSPALCTAWP